MFNSQKINNDPNPWTSDPWGKRSASKYGPEFSLGDWNRREEPRPEYDNNPNPILVAFRESKNRNAKSWHYMVCSDLVESVEGGYSEKYLVHARKVLERLVNVYG